MPKQPPIGRDTRFCMSLSGRPGNFGSRFHNRLYALLGLDYVYKAFSTTDLDGAIRGVRALGIRGCAISMPFKEAVIPLVDRMAGSAAAIDSVNTIVNDGGVLTAYNTDYGAVAELMGGSGIDPGTPFLLRGSGGMAKAVVAALRDSGFRDGRIAARNAAAGRALAERYGFRWSPDIGEQGAPFLINVTPIGMEGPHATELAFPEEMIRRAEAVMDVVALPSETPLTRLAEQLGKICITGDRILVLQGLQQFILYTGITPGPDQVAEAARFATGR